MGLEGPVEAGDPVQEPGPQPRQPRPVIDADADGQGGRGGDRVVADGLEEVLGEDEAVGGPVPAEFNHLHRCK